MDRLGWAAPTTIQAPDENSLLLGDTSNRQCSCCRRCCQCRNRTLRIAELAGKGLTGLSALGFGYFLVLPLAIPVISAAVVGGAFSYCTEKVENVAFAAGIAGTVGVRFVDLNFLKAEALESLKYWSGPTVVGAVLWVIASYLNSERDPNLDTPETGSPV